MPITITVTGDDAYRVREEVREVFSFHSGFEFRPRLAGDAAQASADVAAADAAARQIGENIDGSPRRETVAADVPKARRGRPPNAKTQAAMDAVRSGDVVTTGTVEQTLAELNAPAPASSTTPEGRVNPDDEAGDEADGIEDMQEPGAKLTIDDLRNAAGRINRALGNNPAKAQELAAPAFVKHGVKSISTCPDDKLAAMIEELNGIAAGVEGVK